MTMETRFQAALQSLPLVAILRGIRPEEAVDVGLALTDAGFTLIEVPLNSPDPLDSISRLARALPHALVGAGTVLSVADVAGVHAAGAQLVVSPNHDPAVVRATRERGLLSLPGVMTPSEAFAALAGGAHALKLFPAEAVPPEGLRAMRAVLPPQVQVLPVGGIGTHNMGPWRAAGANGFGIGSALYRPGKSAQAVAADAALFAQAWLRSGGTIQA